MRWNTHAPLETRERIATVAAVLAVVVGITLRVGVIVRGNSLWIDEAMLALNVLGRGWGSLATPLDWGQAAPVGFLWVLKALTKCFGASEWVFRVWPLAAGVGTLMITWLAGRRLVGAPSAACATVVMAVSFVAVRYSTEAKPYASDALVSMAIVWIGLAVHAEPQRVRRWLWLAVAGLAGVLLSYPAAFVLAAVGLALARDAWRSGWRARTAWVACSGVWVLALANEWFLARGDGGVAAYLRDVWGPAMLNAPGPGLLWRARQALAAPSALLLRHDAGGTLAQVAIGLWIIGLLLLLWRRRGFAAAVLGVPVLLALAASFAGAYPLADRLGYFAAPLALLVMGTVVAEFAEFVGCASTPRARHLFVAGSALVIAVFVRSDAWRASDESGMLEPTRALFRGVQADATRRHVPVYVYARAIPAWVYGTTDWTSPDRGRFAFYRRVAGRVDGPSQENRARDGAVAPESGDRLATTDRGTPGGLSGPVELAGLASGVMVRVVGPPSRDGPSPGWAAHEAARIAAAAQPEVWVAASHFLEGLPLDELRPLVDAIRAAGLHVIQVRRGGRDAVALLVSRTAGR